MDDYSRDPLVSIIIPAYNAQQWIAAAIDSVLAQDWPRLEVIVIDDGSSDRTGDVCQAFRDRIRYVHQQNAGVSAARNRGIAMASGQLVGFLDADDLLLPGCVRRLAEALIGHSQAGAASGAYISRGSDDDRRMPSAHQVLGPGPTVELVPHFFRIYAHVPLVRTGSVLIRREVFGRIGGFRDGMRAGEDIEMWCRIAGQYEWVYTDEPVMIYHWERSGRELQTMGSGMAPVYDEQQMQRHVRPELWEDYRVYRRDLALYRCRSRLAAGMMSEVRRFLRRIPPAPPSWEWRLMRVASRLPAWLARRLAGLALWAKSLGRLMAR